MQGRGQNYKWCLELIFKSWKKRSQSWQQTVEIGKIYPICTQTDFNHMIIITLGQGRRQSNPGRGWRSFNAGEGHFSHDLCLSSKSNEKIFLRLMIDVEREWFSQYTGYLRFSNLIYLTRTTWACRLNYCVNKTK